MSTNSYDLDSPIFYFALYDSMIRGTTIGGEHWYIANDVARALGYSNPTKAVRTHCSGARVIKGKEGARFTNSRFGITVIKEEDVLLLIINSHFPMAQQFKAWVKKIVLRQIRSANRYTPHPPAHYLLTQPCDLEFILKTNAGADTSALGAMSEPAEAVSGNRGLQLSALGDELGLLKQQLQSLKADMQQARTCSCHR